MNAIDFLISEHNKVRNELEKIAGLKIDDPTRRAEFDKLASHLIRHETMEHQIWYPHFKNNALLSDTVKHLLKEEGAAERAIQQLENVNDNDKWQDKFTKFKDDVGHHANEEEYLLFPEVKKLLSAAELEKIGKEMADFMTTSQGKHM